jgi:hypothetical protein
MDMPGKSISVSRGLIVKQTKYRNFVQKEASRRGWGFGFHGKNKKEGHKKERQDIRQKEIPMELATGTMKPESNNEYISSVTENNKDTDLAFIGAARICESPIFERCLTRNSFLLTNPIYSKFLALASLADETVLLDVLESACWFTYHRPNEGGPGGLTLCSIRIPFDEEDGSMYEASATCHPSLDMFNKKIGKNISRSRAYEKALLDRDPDLETKFKEVIQQLRQNRRNTT